MLQACDNATAVHHSLPQPSFIEEWLVCTFAAPQVFFSKRCPLFQRRLSLLHKLLYTNGTWAYFATVLTSLTFILVPFISLVLGWHPVVITKQASQPSV